MSDIDILDLLSHTGGGCPEHRNLSARLGREVRRLRQEVRYLEEESRIAYQHRDGNCRVCDHMEWDQLNEILSRLADENDRMERKLSLIEKQVTPPFEVRSSVIVAVVQTILTGEYDE